MSWVYLAAITGSALCIRPVDHRRRLVVSARPLRAVATVAIEAASFLLWQVRAIAREIHRHDQSPAMSGTEILPDLPLEELPSWLPLSYLIPVLRSLVYVPSQRRVRAQAVGRRPVCAEGDQKTGTPSGRRLSVVGSR